MRPSIHRPLATALGVACALTAAGAHAEPVPTLSLRAALAFARAHQPSLAAAEARARLAAAQAEVPRATQELRIAGAAELLLGTSNNSTASYASVGLLDVARVGGSPANAAVSWRPEPSTLIGVSAHRELYDFGRAAAQADALDALAAAAGERARAAGLDLDLYVEDSFYAVLGGRAILTAADAATARARAHRDFAAARVAAQLMPPIELARAEAEVARDEAVRQRAEGALAVAQTVLAGALGADAARVDAGADDLAIAEPSAAAIPAALERAPEVRASAAELRAQAQVTAALRAETRPDLALSAEVTARAGGAAASNPSPTGDGWLPAIPNWDALVVLTWPLRDPVVTARARAAERQERVRAAELAQVSAQLRAGAARAAAELDAARATVPALARTVEAVTANHAQAEARFRGGLGTAIELADAEALLTDAQIQLAVGEVQLARARARLARILGEGAP